MQEQKDHFAFICYKREDDWCGKWQQDKLEYYRFLKNLNSWIDLQNHIRPTFCDVTALNPGLLSEEMDNALHNSELLIVVYSLRSAILRSLFEC